MTKKIKVPTESQEQQRLVLKLSWHHPDLVFFAVPNGGRRGKGEARKMQLEGVQPGIPDIFIAEPFGEFLGLFVELKRDLASRSKTSDAQYKMHKKLTDKGYRVVIAYGAAHAYEEILSYLNISA